MTFVTKFVFPSLWIPGFGAGAIASFFAASPPLSRAGFLFAWVAGPLFIWWACARLKKVRIDGSNLYVSNYLQEICVSADAVSDVTENRWLNIHPVTIHFRRDTPFGCSVIFMPKGRMIPFLSHPIVNELRALSVTVSSGDAGTTHLTS
jgi:hypothetical protein